ADHIVELHGGEISVTSEVGVGTVFKVVLPLAGSASVDPVAQGTVGASVVEEETQS
ncbi:MAG: hypothetical protein JRC77_09205, partial [Deltaproteobacteria bacterium]|nr:hypothetical protein [Deltaproteobacteria bacterium]